MKKKLETIDCTPTWNTAFQIYLSVLENGSDEGKRIARTELIRAARLLDSFVEQSKSVK